MKGKIKLDLDKYEIGILINSLQAFRNQKIMEQVPTDGIDHLLIKFVDIYEKKCPLVKAVKDYAR